MIVLIANPDALRELQGWENNGRRLEFVVDGSGSHVVGLEVLHDEYFQPIHDKLNALQQIEFTNYEQNN